MANQRIASALSHQADTTGFMPSAGYEEGNRSFSTDAIIVDIEASLDCLYGEEVELDWGQMLAPVELGSFMFVDCGSQLETTNASLLSSDTCACEQSTYWSEATGVNCSSLPIIYYYHPDYLGSVEFITDMRGDPYQFFLNTIWGENLQNQLAFNTTAFSSRFRFNGKEWDEETGNFYYGARYYDPKISVWLSVDPLSAKFNNLSPYHYTVNNPLNVIDYDGRDTTFASQAVKDDFDKLFHDLSNALARTGERLGKLSARQNSAKNPNGFFGRWRQRKIAKLKEKHKTLLEARNVLSTIIMDEEEFYYDHYDTGGEDYLSGGTCKYNQELGRYEITFVNANSIMEESRHGVGYLIGEVNWNSEIDKPGFYDWTDEFVAKSLAIRMVYHLYGGSIESDADIKKRIEGYYTMDYIKQTWTPQNVK